MSLFRSFGAEGSNIKLIFTSVRFCNDIQGFSLLVTHLSFMSFLSRRMQDHGNLLKTVKLEFWKRDK